MAPSTFESLCAMCQTMLTKGHHETGVDHYPHHPSYKALEQSVKDGCIFCRRFLNKFFLPLDAYQDIQFVINPPRTTIDGSNIFGFSISPKEDVFSLAYKFELHAVDRSLRSEPEFQQKSDGLCFTGSKQLLAYAREWVQTCKSSHPECCIHSTHKSNLPTRLIDVGDPGNHFKPRLVSGDNLPTTAEYITLSHCWGTKTFTTLSITNIQSFYSEIVEQDLPRTFRDSFAITRALGQRYLWIDCLCIIQDSLNQVDWEHESAHLHNVYKNSVCNIAATGGMNPDSGCFFPLDPILKSNVLHVAEPMMDGKMLPGSYILKDANGRWDNWSSDVAGAHLNTRGWVFQERILSPRILHFTKGGIYFECAQGIRDGTGVIEYLDDFAGLKTCLNIPLPDCIEPANLATHKKNVYETWYKLLYQYSGLSLSKDSDRLVALGAIAQEMQNLLGCEYQSGIWKEDIHRGLLWAPVDPPGYPCYSLAPSWSWASILGKIRVPNFSTRLQALAEIVEVSLSTVKGNYFGVMSGGSLKIRSRTLEVQGITNPVTSNIFRFSVSHAGLIFSIIAYIDQEILSNYDITLWLCPITIDEYYNRLHGLILIKHTGHDDEEHYKRIGTFTLLAPVAKMPSFLSKESDGNKRAIKMMTQTHSQIAITIV